MTDNVGDNVGDIAGMGADLFGSFAESTCAALVISSVSSLGADHIYQVPLPDSCPARSGYSPRCCACINLHLYTGARSMLMKVQEDRRHIVLLLIAFFGNCRTISEQGMRTLDIILTMRIACERD